jgi:hypothetical protein
MSKLQQTLIPIKLELSNERLTSMAGLMLVEEAARSHGIWKRVDELFPGPGSGRGHRASEFVRPLVWMQHAGGRHLEDVRELRSEQEVLKRFGLERLPSADAIGDWLRRMGAGGVGVDALQQLNRELLKSYLTSAGEELTLDVDASIIEADKREAQWTYQKVKGYQPLIGYVGEACVHHEFRAGNESPGAGAVAFLKGCEKQLPAGKKIYLRSDSAFYQAAVFNHCEGEGHSFTVTVDQDSAVKGVIAQIPEQKWQVFKTREGLSTDREIAETVHCMNETKAAFRLLVMRWKNQQPSLFETNQYCYHAIASNRDQIESASQIVWLHNMRGESENWHKELKLGFGMEQLPCGQIEANAVYFAIGVLAYNLGLILKAQLLPAEYRHTTVATLRWKLYRLAGKLVRHAGSWVLKVRTESEKLALLVAVRERCFAMT